MRTIEYLTNPEFAGLFWPGVVTALGIALLCSVLSVLVVLKRLAFVGQGVSHAAFGGVGVAAVLGFGATPAVQYGFVAVFCLSAALLISAISSSNGDRRTVPGFGKGGSNGAGGRGTSGGNRGGNGGRGGVGEGGGYDTAIGIVLVGSMALGAVLIQQAVHLHKPMSGGWESILFGSLVAVGWADAAVTWLVALVVLGALWWYRRPMLFWAFDEQVARASGVRTGAMRTLLLLVLALAVVVTMKLVGVVLATAMLVLPGAIALRLSARLLTVVVLSIAAGLAGVILGLAASFELDWQAGASIVLVLCALYAVTRLAPGPRA